MASFVYIQSESQLWTVGHYDGAGKFQPESDHSTPQLAGARVAELNGGNGTADLERAPAGGTLKDLISDLFTTAEGSEGTLESMQGTLEGLTGPAGRIADALEALVKLTERSTVALERMQDHAQFGPGW